MSSKKPPTVKTLQDVLDLSDLRTAYLVMKAMDVDPSGVKDLQQAKDRIIIHMTAPVKPPVELPGKPIHPERRDVGLAISNNKVVRDKMIAIAEKVSAVYSNLDPKIQKSLQQTFPDLLQALKERKEALRTNETYIVLAGEVGSGKSSLINLILESQIFPTDQLKCTNTICEIRYSKKKEAIAYHKPKYSDSDRARKVAPKIIDMGSLRGIQEFKDCVSQCDEQDDNPFDRIEVFWPFKALTEGVVIVDTPGIEGGSNVDQAIQKYLTKSFGFIYVINTNAAGGVQQGRLGHLLKQVVNSCDEFSPEASLFIGNKWENVDEGDKKAVRQDNMCKLSKVYPGIQSEQVHYMSVTTAAHVHNKHGKCVEDHTILLQKIKQLIPNALRQGMVAHYMWLSNILKRASYLLRVTSIQHAMTREELEEQCRGLKEKVDNLQKHTDDSIGDLRGKVEFEIYKITNSMKETLKSRRLLDRLCNWEDTPNDCPRIQKKWKQIADEAAMKISERLCRLVDQWDREEGRLKIIDEKIVTEFATALGLMEHQVKDLEDMMIRNRGGMTQFCHTVKVMPIKTLFSKKQKKIEKTYTTLGGAVSCIGMLDTSKKEVKEVFKDYNERNKTKKMADATVAFLRPILEHRDLQGKLQKFFKRFFVDIDEASKRIPSFLKADQQLIETLSLKLEDDNRISQRYPELVESCQDLVSDLDIFYVNDIMNFDFQLEDMDWKKKKIMGEGCFAVVYKSVIGKHNKPVALKVSKDAVSRSTVTDILTEDRIMKDLRHENVVRYYGSSYVRQHGSTKFIMVMELCESTLKEVYLGEHAVERYIPARYGTDHPHRQSAVRTMLNHTLQMFQGLAYIHMKGYTHRDVKLENILITKEGTIKLTDVGVAKPTNYLSCTVAGSPAYMAPEVLLSTRNHSEKMDIYSAALVFWEMWFGKDVSNDMNYNILGASPCADAMAALKERQSKPDGGYRPGFSMVNRPPDEIIRLMKHGWMTDPETRPTAADVVKYLQTFIRNN